MMSLDPELLLPDLQDVILDDATLRQLVFDIRACARILDVRVKGGATEYASEEEPSLEHALESLAARHVLGVQVRYVHQGAIWRDTLIAVAGGTRLVRTQEPG
jgi:hypothetical protein